MDLLNIGQGVDAFPAVERDELAWSRRYLFDFCLNPLAMRMHCIRVLISRPLTKRRYGLSANSITSRRRGSRHVPLKRKKFLGGNW